MISYEEKQSHLENKGIATNIFEDYILFLKEFLLKLFMWPQPLEKM